MSTAVSLPVIFGDERDTIIAKWNQLQAFWGTGKGFFNQQGQHVTFTPDNPFCSFKVNDHISLQFRMLLLYINVELLFNLQLLFIIPYNLK